MAIIKIGALTKVAENLNDYTRPDGVSMSTYSEYTGFNQEDWLDRASSSSADATKFTDKTSPCFPEEGVQTYCHLPGVHLASKGEFSFNKDSLFDHLAIICDGEMIGYFKDITRLDENSARTVFDLFDNNGVGKTRELEAGNKEAWSNHKQSPLNCLNVRYRPNDLVLFSKPIALKTLIPTSGIVTVTYGGDTFEISDRVLQNALNGRNAVFK